MSSCPARPENGSRAGNRERQGGAKGHASDDLSLWARHGPVSGVPATMPRSASTQCDCRPVAHPVPLRSRPVHLTEVTDRVRLVEHDATESDGLRVGQGGSSSGGCRCAYRPKYWSFMTAAALCRAAVVNLCFHACCRRVGAKRRIFSAALSVSILSVSRLRQSHGPTTAALLPRILEG